MTSSLLGVAARHDKHKMLDLLLKRGADPNGGPAPLTAGSPVEEAFCSCAYSSLKRLLEIPDLEIPMTESLLHAWGALTDDASDSAFVNPCGLWCCQLLQERLTGEPVSAFEPLPVPAGLRLGHALHHANYELAIRICTVRPLTDEDATDVLAHYAPDRLDCTLFGNSACSGNLMYAKREQEIRFLCQLLHCRPELVETTQLRTAVVLAALSLPEEDPFLAYWTQRLEDGPVLLPQLPVRRDLQLSSFQFVETFSVEQAFFSRWEQRFGSRLIPAMDINQAVVQDLSSDSTRLLLQHVRFVGTPPTEVLSSVAVQVLLHAPEELLPGLLEPNGLLAREQPHLLLDACQLLPVARRNLVVPLIQKRTDYQL